MSRPESTVSANVSTSKDLVRGTDPPTPKAHTQQLTTVFTCRVRLSAYQLPRSNDRRPRKLGADGCGSEVHDACLKPNVAPKLTRRIGKSFLTEDLEPKSALSESPKREINPEQTSLRRTLCTTHGITPPGNTETYKMLKLRLYKVLHI